MNYRYLSLGGAPNNFFMIFLVFLRPVYRGLCINRNNHHKPTFHPLGNFLNPALALLGQGLKKSPIGALTEVDEASILIGPEGGLSEIEINQANQAGYRSDCSQAPMTILCQCN
jgi:hypothetical protein